MSNRFDEWNQPIIDEFRGNSGHVDRFGKALVLLHHVGAKSGAERISPVMGIHVDDDTWLVAASKAGAPENPAWYHNLLAHPETRIETPDDGVVDVRAEKLVGQARDDAWAMFTERSEGFRQYEERTTRVIPVLELRRR